MNPNLIKIALVGTGKVPATALSGGDEIAGLIPETSQTAIEENLLLQGGAWAIYQQAGQRGKSIPKGSTMPVDRRAILKPELQPILQREWESSNREFFLLLIRKLATCEILLPPGMLPKVLAVREHDFRKQIFPVIGERGKWLASINPDWTWALKDDLIETATIEQLRKIFEEGKLTERSEAFTKMRMTDAEQARNLLIQVFPQEKADVRTMLLGALQDQLSQEDEPFLESCLDDRSSNVREVAANLLARLPQSAFSERMQQRADAILAVTDGKFRLKCTPPQELNKADERDTLTPKPPANVGKRAFWLQEILSKIPPSYYTQRFGKTPDELLQAIESDEYQADVLNSWINAAIKFHSTDVATKEWFKPLWDLAYSKSRKLMQQHSVDLLTNMSSADAESALATLLFGDSLKAEDYYVPHYLTYLPKPWSAGFTRQVLDYMRQMFQKLPEEGTKVNSLMYSWLNIFGATALAIPEECLEEALSGWKIQEEVPAKSHAEYWQRHIKTFLDQLQTRLLFQQQLST